MLISAEGCCCFDVPFAPPRIPPPFFGPIIPTGKKLARPLDVARFALLHFESVLRILYFFIFHFTSDTQNRVYLIAR